MGDESSLNLYEVSGNYLCSHVLQALYNIFHAENEGNEATILTAWRKS